MKSNVLQFVICVFITLSIRLNAQEVKIYEKQLNMKTYMFSDPSPIPQIGRLYPYSRFDGYTTKGEDKTWNMVVLENKYIKVFVCPDIGGKIWGAIEKSTGNEFLYFNHSVKFRDVAMRGAWTSGGLEYNFGDIGHIPTCATPVDYRLKKNKDGSVSCIVGALDLPSRTNWNVEIKLGKDKAYFQTKATWFNNTSLPVTYYHWMNAAAKADGNLEFLYPGNKRIGHGGELDDWPIDDSKEIAFYENNNFGIYKSYHVINAYTDYFGGYYHDDDFGFGHYGTYDDKPGKKIWIWGLSDQGMIWENLLTDTDGQYIEYQAGKMFNQAANSSTFTPFKHREFSPHDTDKMHEYWFPLKETKGMVAASKTAVLNSVRKGNQVTLYLSALENLKETLIVKNEDQILIKEQLEKSPLELYTVNFTLESHKNFEVELGAKKLYYNSKEALQNLERPLESNDAFNWNSAYGVYIQALEFEKQRRYSEALQLYLKSYKLEQGFIPTLNRLAMGYYRINKYGEALNYAKLSLGIDTYDALGNYVYGLIQNAKGNKLDAKSGFSIATNSPSYRAAAYTELAKIYFIEKNYIQSKHYLKKALIFNKYNLTASEMLAVLYRKEQKFREAKKVLSKLTYLDASNHFINSEKVFLKFADVSELTQQISNELPVESYLELALKYYNLGLTLEAVEILKLSPENPITLLWLAYLNKDKEHDYLEKALAEKVTMVFPHRVETIEVLRKFIKLNGSWKLKYYLSLIYWNKDLIQEAKELIKDCGDKPESVAFYLARAKMFSEDAVLVEKSLENAFQINKEDWRVSKERIERYLEKGKHKMALKIARKFKKKHPENVQFGMLYAKVLMKMKSYHKCIKFLQTYKVLPYEGATDGRRIYHKACIKSAYESLKKGNYKKAIELARQAKLWPKNLGVGKHYDVDERLDNSIIAFGWEQLGKYEKSLEVYEMIARHKTPNYLNEGSKLVLQLFALRKMKSDNLALKLLDAALDKSPENQYLKWAVATYKGNKNVGELQKYILNSNTFVQVYDTKYVDTGFVLLLEFIDLIKNYKVENDK